MRKFLDEGRGIEFVVVALCHCPQESKFLFRELRQISVELSFLKTPEDNRPEVHRICKRPSVVMAPEFAADECKEVGMAEGLAVEPLRQLPRIETDAAEYGAGIFD